jgi:hypothetical protein
MRKCLQSGKKLSGKFPSLWLTFLIHLRYALGPNLSRKLPAKQQVTQGTLKLTCHQLNQSLDRNLEYSEVICQKIKKKYVIRRSPTVF